ncbi:Gfo/Idh/MocA family oxidoreductase [Nesterenkonia xinjiangensis]|uniref:Putative dehydrogenase n=1 Tax=Nesterenkonia xinjiangensis TaxID=225327 RepID=A0A7Z0K9X7_9MICC|nr:putative dehydrogenase [Nesterenkonia xinjiangensis]
MLKVAIIGSGSISALHIQAYQDFPERCEIIAFVDVSTDNARTRRDEFGLFDARVYTTVEEMLGAGESVDVASICTPPSTHEPLSVACLQAGVNVLCEKPMAPSLDACDRILAAEQSSDAVFASVAQNRYRDDVAQLRSVLDSGLLGDVTRVVVDSSWWRGLPYYDLWWRGTWETEGGGCTLNHAVHHIDLLLWLLGRPESVTAVLANVAHENAEIEDLSVAVFQYRRALATVTSSVVDHGERAGITVQGRDASYSLSGEAIAEVTQPHGFGEDGGDPHRVAEVDAVRDAVPPLAHTLHRGQIDDFLTAVETGTRPAVDGHDGRLTIEVITAIYAAGIERRAIDLPLAAEDPFAKDGALLERAPRFYTKSASIRAFNTTPQAVAAS